ncbi:hypothetical protein K431DRAFT_282399 [Polychaeton citri CBS 116435]|uniref:Gag1-like clamp domain-containing protein n=1 Tax=Polychaeton citri CBS 116435 TaxID=1314669 RepID=A0A9P4QCZ3_9PEZI|nr:hypothetical protein K431DRAFT_282399 [Polychaeton citri CBS 116435]
MPWDTLEGIAHSLGHHPPNPSHLGIIRSASVLEEVDEGQENSSAVLFGSHREQAAATQSSNTMTLHLGLHHHGHRSSQQQQSEIREARRLLREQVRTDWEYPTLPKWQSSGRKTRGAEKLEDENGRTIGGFKVHNNTDDGEGDNAIAILSFEPSEWKERSYSSSESGEEIDLDDRELSASMSSRKKSIKHVNEHTYRFEGPDSVGIQIQDRRLAKKRKRQALLQEEMAWNDGMRHWMARRDVWCAVRTREQLSAIESEKANAAARRTNSTTTTATATASNPSSPRTSTSSTSAQAVTAPSTAPTSSTSTPLSPPNLSALSLQPAPAPTSTALLPLAPPLLPNNPVRARIGISTYPEIYNKIILQSRTPSVPINLLTLTRALVKGWKDDGEWPPKPGVIEKSFAKQRKAGGSRVKEGVKGAVGKVLRITHVGGGGGHEGG